MNTTAATPCEELLNDTKRIFGDQMVVGAWFIDSGLDLIRQRNRSMSDAANYESTGDADIDLSTNCSAMLEFVNGRKVIFSTSEWGGIKLNDEPLIFYTLPERH